MTQKLIENYLSDASRSFESYKRLGEKAIEQVSDEEFFRVLDDKSNSIAVIVKHVAGNLRSRWTDFLSSDGEKPDRNRDTEFELMGETRASLMESWEAGWQILFDSIEPLSVEDFDKKIEIRGEEHTIAEALNRQMTHYAYHIGQITFLAKHFRSAEWSSLSVPRNKSDEFNRFLANKKAEGEKQIAQLDSSMEFASKDCE